MARAPWPAWTGEDARPVVAQFEISSYPQVILNGLQAVKDLALSRYTRF